MQRSLALAASVSLAIASVFAMRARERVPPVPGTFRVLAWNVSDSAWLKQAEATRAILRHADADVLILAQVAPGLEPDVRALLRGLRGAADTTWFISARQNDSYETTLIAARDSVKGLPEFALLTFPDTGGLGRNAAIPSGPGAPARRDSVTDVHTNGAMVRVGGEWILVVGVHLTSSGSQTDWREYRRELGATLIRQSVMRVLSASRPAGIVVAGDMNLAGGPAPLDTLLGMARNGPLGPMRRAEALQPDGWTDWTWDGRGTAFNGGRLDNLIYSSGSLAVKSAIVWETELMSPDTLRAHGLTADMSRSINRHRPIVVELRPRPGVAR
ncbi:MAG: endonuclease/exonuclease/phosphatase family protein [Gemmatimonadaceae bacterium]